MVISYLQKHGFLTLLCLLLSSNLQAQGLTFSSTFGTNGTGDGEFSFPVDVEIDASGNIFVADRNNERIQKFNSSFVFQTKWGSQGTGNGQFSLNGMDQMMIDASGNIWVADRGNHRYQQFSNAGVYLTQFGSSGTGNVEFDNPTGIGIDGSGNFYVVDKNNHRIQKLSSTFTYITEWGSQGSSNGQFSTNGTEGLVFDASGDIWVADRGNDRLQKFSDTGTFLAVIGGVEGTADGQFSNPVDIAIHPTTGNLYVSDRNNERIQYFDPSGNFLGKFGTIGTGNGEFSSNGLVGIAFNSTGTKLYAADRNNHRIQVFDVAAVATDPTWNSGAWSPAAPTSTDNAIIDDTYDVTANGNIACANLTINSGNTLTMTSGTISITGNFDNNGNAFNQTGGTFTFNGSSAQSIEGSNTFDDLVINNSAGVTLNSATTVTGVLTLTAGTLASGGLLTLGSTATGAGNTATVDFSGSGTISGNVIQQRFLDGATQEGYRYVAAAVAGQTLAAINDDVSLNHLGAVFSPGTNVSTYDRDGYTQPLPNIFYYDQSLVSSGTISMGDLNGQTFNNAEIGWEIPASTATSFNPGSAVAINIGASNVTLDFTGTLQSTDVVLSLAHGGQSNSGWHLIGNPFAATLDWNAVYDDAGNTGIEPTAYVFDAASTYAGTYAGYNAATNAAVNGGSQNIASGQGFFIQTTSGMTGNVTLKNSHTATSDVQFFRTQEEMPWFGELRLELSNEQGQKDELLIYSIEEAHDGKDIGDAKKFFGQAYGLPEIASQAFDFPLMMDCRAPLSSETQSYSLSIKGGSIGTFTLKAASIAQFEAGTEVFLEDRKENILVDLTQVPEYHFEIHSAEEAIEDRFQVHLRVNRVTSIEKDLADRGIALIATGNQVNIQFADATAAKSQIAVYDLMGKLIQQQRNEAELNLNLNIPQAGMYIIRIENGNGIIAKRVIIR